MFPLTAHLARIVIFRKLKDDKMRRRTNPSIGLLGAMLIAVLGMFEFAAAQDYDRDNAADVYAQARKMMSRPSSGFGR